MFRFAGGLCGKIENFVMNLPYFFQFFWTNSWREKKCVNLLCENPLYFFKIFSQKFSKILNVFQAFLTFTLLSIISPRFTKNIYVHQNFFKILSKSRNISLSFCHTFPHKFFKIFPESIRNDLIISLKLLQKSPKF